MRKSLTILFTCFCLDSFCQKDSLIVTVGDQSKVKRYDIEYSKDGSGYSVIDSIKVVQSKTVYSIALKNVTSGYYRIHVLGVNQYSDIKKVFNVLAVDKYKLTITKQGKIFE